MKNCCVLLKRSLQLGLLLFLSACASFSGSNLKPGVATLPDVLAAMGEPAIRWDDPDGRVQLAYPLGPAGTKTFMLFLGADGRLKQIENVLDAEHFARIENGKTDQAAVLRLLGPSFPPWTVYFEGRNELVWEWNFCDAWNQLARFDVLFDATSGIVRSTFQRREYVGRRGGGMNCAN